MKRFSHTVLFVAFVWCFGIPASAQEGDDKGTTKSPHLESLEWPKQLLDDFIKRRIEANQANEPKSSSDLPFPKPNASEQKPEGNPSPENKTATTKPSTKAPLRVLLAEENSLASLDAEIDMIAVALLQLRQPDAVIELYDRWYTSYKTDDQAASNGSENLKKFRTLAAYLNSVFAERMLAQQLLSPKTVDADKAVELKSRVEIFEKANVRYAGAISTISSGLQAYEEWRTKGLPKPDIDNDVLTGKFSTSPMTAFRSAEFFQMLLLWQGRLYRELGDVVYRETGSSFATSKIDPPKGHKNSTARAWYLLARDPLYMGIVLDKNNREVQREAELVALRLGWIDDNRIFGGVDFFQFPTHREGYITEFFQQLDATYLELAKSDAKAFDAAKSQAAWITNLRNQQRMRDSLDRGFAEMQRDGLEKSLADIKHNQDAVKSRVAWERLQYAQTQLTNANLYVTNDLALTRLKYDSTEEETRLTRELNNVLGELQLHGLYGVNELPGEEGELALKNVISGPNPASEKDVDSRKKRFKTLVTEVIPLAESFGITRTNRDGGKYAKLGEWITNKTEFESSRGLWQEIDKNLRMTQMFTHYIDLVQKVVAARGKAAELDIFDWRVQASIAQNDLATFSSEVTKAHDAINQLIAAREKTEDEKTLQARRKAAEQAVVQIQVSIQDQEKQLLEIERRIESDEQLLKIAKEQASKQTAFSSKSEDKYFLLEALASNGAFHTTFTIGFKPETTTNPMKEVYSAVRARLESQQNAYRNETEGLSLKAQIESRSSNIAALREEFNKQKSFITQRNTQLSNAISETADADASIDRLRAFQTQLEVLKKELEEKKAAMTEEESKLMQPILQAISANQRVTLESAYHQSLLDVHKSLSNISQAAQRSEILIDRAHELAQRIVDLTDDGDSLKTYGEAFAKLIGGLKKEELELAKEWNDTTSVEVKNLSQAADDFAQKLMELNSPKERVVTADFLKQFTPAFVDAELTGKMQADLDLANQHLANVARWLYLFSGEQNRCLQLATPARSVGELQMAIENARSEWEIVKGTVVVQDRPSIPPFGSKHSAVVVRLVAQPDINNNTSRLTLETRYDNLENPGYFNADEDELYKEFFAQNGANRNSQEIAGYMHALSPSGSCRASLPGVFSKYKGQQAFVTGIWLFPRSMGRENKRLSAAIEHVGPHFARVNGRRRTMPLKFSVGGGSIKYNDFMSVKNLANVLQQENWRDSKSSFGVDLDKAKPIGLDGTIFGLGLDGTWQISLFEKDASGRDVPYSISQADQVDVVFTFLFRVADNRIMADSAPATMPRLAGIPQVDESAFFGDLLRLRPEGLGDENQSAEKSTDLIKTELDTVFNNRPNAIEATPPVNLLQVRNQAEEILDTLIGSVEKEYVAKLQAAKSTIEDRKPLQDPLNKAITILSEERIRRYEEAVKYAKDLLELQESVIDGGLESDEQKELKTIIDSLNQEMLVRPTLKEWCADETKRQALIDLILNDLVLKYQGAED